MAEQDKKGIIKLKAMPVETLKEEIKLLLKNDENIIQVFENLRDQVVFTNKRVVVASIQGVKSVSYFSYPYSKIQYYGIETAGFLDMDSELTLVYANGAHFKFKFSTKVNIQEICSNISDCIL